MTLLQITVAAVMPADVDRIRVFFEELEEVLVDDRDRCESDVGDWIIVNYHRVKHDWSRLLFAYETMYENACDPTVRHLEWKPEIKAALKLAAMKD